MRKRESQGGLTVNAVAGSYVVFLGLDVSDAKHKGLLGFAIQRKDKQEEETYWMSGTKVFESVEPHPAAGVQYSSYVHPFQSFQWADYKREAQSPILIHGRRDVWGPHQTAGGRARSA